MTAHDDPHVPPPPGELAGARHSLWLQSQPPREDLTTEDSRSTNPPPPDKGSFTTMVADGRHARHAPTHRNDRPCTPPPHNESPPTAQSESLLSPDNEGSFLTVPPGRRTTSAIKAVPPVVVTTPVPTRNAYDILDAPDSPSLVYSSGRTSLGSRIERNMAAAVRERRQALDAKIVAINAIPSWTYCNVPDRLDALRRDMDKTRDLVALLHGDLRRELIATTTALSTSLCTVNENNTRLSAEDSDLSSRILQHQVHLDNLMKFEEACRAQMDNHWRAMETLTSLVEAARADSTLATTALESLSATVVTVQSETTSNATAPANLAVSVDENKSEATTQNLHLLAQLNGLRATTEATTMAARTDINDIRGHLLPALRKRTDDVFASVKTVTHSITDLTHRVETCEAAHSPTRDHGDRSSPRPVPDAFPRDSPDLRATQASHRSNSSWYHGAKPRHDDGMGPPVAGAASPGNIGLFPPHRLTRTRSWGGRSPRPGLPTRTALHASVTSVATTLGALPHRHITAVNTASRNYPFPLSTSVDINPS
jgi:hypothetical protein